jgi:hypothetical protein
MIIVYLAAVGVVEALATNDDGSTLNKFISSSENF